MRLISICTAVLLLPVMLTCQDGGQKPATGSIYDQLSETLAKQATAYQAARKALQQSDAFKAARKARDNNKLRELLASLKPPDAVGLAKQAIAAADKAEGDEAAKLLGWAAATCRNTEMVKDIVARLEREHLKSKGLLELMETGSILSRPLGEDGAKTFLEKVLAESPHNLVKAWAIYWQAQAMKRRGVDQATAEAAQALVDQAAQLAPGTWLADKINGPRFRKERLQIGMVAPNIVGDDIDGVRFELDDYRGKVVVLDFWGFW